MSGFRPLPPDPAVDRLLSETYLRLRQGRFAEAQERLTQAQAQAPDHPAVIEMEGDLANAQGRYTQAQTLYKRALEHDRHNTKLEEKYATAVLKAHAPELAAHDVPDDSPWTQLVKRNPTVSAMQSAILPGLGQFYNGDLLKGLIVISLAILGNFIQLRLIGNLLYDFNSGGISPSIPTFLGAWFSGPQLIITLVLLILWGYAVVDAALTANNAH